MNICGYIQTSI